MHWCPRHTPSTGICPANASMASSDMPAESGAPGPGYDDGRDAEAGEVGKALVVGLLGGLISAAGYMIYRRLPEEQKEKLHSQVRDVVQQRVQEFRRNLNI